MHGVCLIVVRTRALTRTAEARAVMDRAQGRVARGKTQPGRAPRRGACSIINSARGVRLGML
jgi:hypothetical protein